MEQLYQKLYKTYIRTLHGLNIGYKLEKSDVLYLFDLINAIDYIKNGCPTKTEFIKIIAYYE